MSCVMVKGDRRDVTSTTVQKDMRFLEHFSACRVVGQSRAGYWFVPYSDIMIKKLD